MEMSWELQNHWASFFGEIKKGKSGRRYPNVSMFFFSQSYNPISKLKD